MNGIHRVTQMVPWQEAWEAAFTEEKQRIAEAMASAGLNGSIYHVGSTSVKGMISKPIIDILLCPDKGISLEVFFRCLKRTPIQIWANAAGLDGISSPKATKRIRPSICICAMKTIR